MAEPQPLRPGWDCSQQCYQCVVSTGPFLQVDFQSGQMYIIVWIANFIGWSHPFNLLKQQCFCQYYWLNSVFISVISAQRQKFIEISALVHKWNLNKHPRLLKPSPSSHNPFCYNMDNSILVEFVFLSHSKFWFTWESSLFCLLVTNFKFLCAALKMV